MLSKKRNGGAKIWNGKDEDERQKKMPNLGKKCASKIQNQIPIPVIFNNFVLCLLDTSERWTKDELECAFDKNNVKKIISKRRLKNSKMSAWLLRYENSILLLIRAYNNHFHFTIFLHCQNRINFSGEIFVIKHLSQRMK